MESIHVDRDQYYSAPNQEGRSPPKENFSPHLEKCFGHNLKTLDIVQKFEPLSENSLPLLVPHAGYRPDIIPRLRA